MLLLGLIVVIFLTSSSTARVVRHKNEDADFNSIRSRKSISQWCHLSKDKSELDCSNVKFLGRSAGIRVKINKCESPVTINFKIIVKTLGLDWSRTLTSNQEFAVPGFEYDVGGLAKAGAYVQFTLYQDDGDNKLKMKLLLKVKVIVGNTPIKEPEVALYDGSIPVETYFNFSWSRLSINEKVGIIAGIVIGCILLLVLIVCIYTRCGKSRNKNERSFNILQNTKGGKANGKFSNNCFTQRNSVKNNNNTGQSSKLPNSAVLQNIRSYENEQFAADQTNIKVPVKPGPQKFKMVNLFKPS